MADVCEVTGTGVDLMGDAFPNGLFQLQRTGDASSAGTDDVSIGQPIPLVTNASGVFGHFENGSFVAGFALVQNSTYYLTPFRADTRAALPRIVLFVPDGTTSANIATLVIAQPVPPLDQAAQAVLDAQAAATAAAAAEANAAASETAAAQSASAAATSETNAGTSAGNAATSETNAGTSASAAATSAGNAATSETNAANSASAAATSETNAGNSATAAATSETNAGNSATAAASSATAAAQSATDAAGFVGQDLFATTATAVTLTISSGSVAIPSGGDADIEINSTSGTETLNTITGAALNKFITLRPASGDTITLTHTTSTANGFALGGSDVVLSAPTDTLVLRYNGTLWTAVGGSALVGGGGGGGVWAAIGAPTDVSGASTVDFTGFDATTYVDYRFVFRNLVPSINSRVLRIATSSNGGSSYDTAVGSYASSLGNNNPIVLSPAGNNANGRIIGDLTIFEPNDSTSLTGMTWAVGNFNTTGTTLVNGVGYRGQAAIVNAVRFDLSSGTFTSGEIQMEGRLIAT